MSDPDISNSMRRIVPEDLSTTGLVDGARRKRRQRTGMVSAVAALAVVALAIPVALNLPQNGPIVAQPATTPTAPQTGEEQTVEPAGSWPLPGPVACYNEDGSAISWTQYGYEPAEPAPPGAVKAWFCGDYAPETGGGFVGPLEPLTSGLDAIIEGVQAAETIDLTRTTCKADYRLSFNVVFEYADGSRRVIGGDRHGCGTTYDGGITRVGVEGFYDALYTGWEEQRATDTGDWVVPNICPGPFPLMETHARDAVQGSVCGEGSDGSFSGTYLSDELVAEITDAITTMEEGGDEETAPPVSDMPEQRVWLTLSNKFTDSETFVRHEDGIYRAYDGQGMDWFWQPPEDLARKLDEALATAGTTNVPPVGPRASSEPGGTYTPFDHDQPIDEGPQQFVPEGCQDAWSGVMGSTDLPDGGIPDGAERVWLCASGEFQSEAPVPPVEPLDDPDFVSQAAAAFNDLALLPADQACTMELGPSYLVVHEYADGTRYAVEMQDFGCMSVTGGSVVKADSMLYKEKLLELWSLQRENTGSSQTRPAPLCPLTVSMFILNLEDGFTAGAACVGAGEMADGNVVATHEVDLPEDLIGQIAEQLTNSVDAVEYAADGNSLVLLTKTGDPFLLFRDTDGTFHGWQGEFGKVWTPTGATAEALVAIFDE